MIEKNSWARMVYHILSASNPLKIISLEKPIANDQVFP